MAGGQQLPEQYTVPQLARIFHSLPHLNVSLHSVNNTFNPHSEIYLEVNRGCVCMYMCVLSDRFINSTFLSIIGIGRISSSLLSAEFAFRLPCSTVCKSISLIWNKRNERVIWAFWALFQLISNLLGERVWIFVTQFSRSVLWYVFILKEEKDQCLTSSTS